MKDREAYDVERNIQFNILTPKMKEKINEGALSILEDIGMKISGERTLKKLAGRGVVPGADGMIHIPRSLVQWALDVVPKEITLYGMDGNPRMVIDKSNRVYFGTHNDMNEIVDYKTNKARPMLLEDIQTMCKIASNCENIDFVLSVGLIEDVDPRIQSQMAFIESCKYMEKTINFSTNDVDSLQEIIDIAAELAGGHEKLREKPFIFNYCEPIPPLTHPFESTEKLYVVASNGIPTVYMPYCMMGGTAPMDRPTTLAQCFAEILCGLVITQLIREGTPYIAGSMPSIIDMQSTIASYACPEFHMMVAASSEMADYYQLPFYGTCGTSDVRTFDQQSAGEISFQILSTLLSKANIVHDMGLHDHCVNICPAAVVWANDKINGMKSYVRGVQGDVDLSLIREVGAAGNYLSEENTVERFRDEVWYPEIETRRNVTTEESELYGRIVERIDTILAENPGSKLPQEKLDFLDKKAKEFLARVQA